MPWTEPDPDDPFAPRRYELSTKEKFVERAPDKRPSDQGTWTREHKRNGKKSIVTALEVTREGALVYREARNDEDGHWEITGIAIFTTQDILFDS